MYDIHINSMVQTIPMVQQQPAISSFIGHYTCLVMLALLSPPALAADIKPSGSTWYDATQSSISRSLDESVTWFDNFFSDPRYRIDEKADASLRITLDGFYSGVDGESNFKVKANGHISLPRFENRVRVTFSSDIDESVSGQDAVNNDTVGRSSSSEDSGLGLAYFFRDRPNHVFSLGGGIKGGPDLYVNYKHRYTNNYSKDTRLRLTNTVYYATDDGVGASSLLDFEHFQSKNTIWRYTLFGNVNEITNGMEWSTQGTWLHRLDEQSAVSVRIGMDGQTGKKRTVDEGWATVRYRGNIWRPWMFYEVEPGLSWHQKVNYDLEPTMALRLELQF